MRLPGRHIRSAVNDSLGHVIDIYEIPTTRNDNETNDESVQMEEDNLKLLNYSHKINKRLDPSLDQYGGMAIEATGVGKQTSNLEFNSSSINNSTTPHPSIHIVTHRKRQNRQRGQDADLPTVTIHNIISGLPKPEIEMLYAVYLGLHFLP